MKLLDIDLMWEVIIFLMAAALLVAASTTHL